METTAVKLYSLDYRDAKTYLAAALFVAGNIVLPQICHLVPQGGLRWLPIYFFTLVGAYKYGWRVGLLTAVLSPLVNSALFGMPAAAALPAILLKSVLLAAAAGFAARRFGRATLPLLGGAGRMGLYGFGGGRRAGFPHRDSRHARAGGGRLPDYQLSVTQINPIDMINRMYVIILLSVLPLTACGSAQGGEKTEAPEVYFIREITPRNMVRIYEAQERPATGKVAVKLSTGEPDGHNYLKPELIKEIVTKVGGTIVECNTAYGGGRAHTEAHLKAAADHGFTAIAPVDIMDADGEVSLPVKGGRHLKENFVGSHYPRYDFTVVLSHFKGHAMGGFGGAVKNISIGIASSAGKAWIHSAGKTKNAAEMWSDLPAQDDFLESMAESAKSVADHCGDRILYISVMNNLSVDCDCDAHPEEPKMGDIGILASLDPVALDKACVDMVYASPDPGKSHLIERMESRHGIHTLEHAEAIGLGSQQYRLVELK